MAAWLEPTTWQVLLPSATLVAAGGDGEGNFLPPKKVLGGSNTSQSCFLGAIENFTGVRRSTEDGLGGSNSQPWQFLSR